MGKKYLAGALLLLLPWLLSACMLLPTEEEARTAPLISTYTKTAYQTEQVKRETLIEEKNITCRYVPVQSAGLSFGVGGEYIDEVLVQLGDSVQEGQILAYLNLEDMQEKIDAAKDALEETALRIRHLDALEEVAMRRCILEQEGKAESTLAAALEKVQKEYAKKRQHFLARRLACYLIALYSHRHAKQVFASARGKYSRCPYLRVLLPFALGLAVRL